jgi:hypothetical protein
MIDWLLHVIRKIMYLDFKSNKSGCMCVFCLLVSAILFFLFLRLHLSCLTTHTCWSSYTNFISFFCVWCELNTHKCVPLPLETWYDQCWPNLDGFSTGSKVKNLPQDLDWERDKEKLGLARLGLRIASKVLRPFVGGWVYVLSLIRV